MQNDITIFWNLIDENRALLWRFALGLARSRDDAKDLISETVLAAHDSFPKLRDLNGFRKSLYTIASRIYKRKRWRHRIFDTLDAAFDIEDSRREESSHDLELLMRALHMLPVKQREAILLFELTGLSLEEIREVQGGTLSGVKSRVKRGREELQRLLSDESKVVIFPETPESFFEMSVPSMTIY